MTSRRSLRLAALWIVLLALAGAGAWYLLVRSKAEEKPAWRTETVSRGAVTATVTATGTLSAVTTVQVGSQVSGIIAGLNADFNSRVRRGQLLAELDPTPFIAQVEQRRADKLRAEVNARNSQLSYERQQKLLEEGLTSQTEYDAAKATWEADQAMVLQASAALNQADTNLRYTKILSPIDGVVVDRQYDVGQTVAASFQAPTLFTIAQDLTRMQVQADVDQSDIGRVRVGMPSRFTVDAYPGEEFRGQITQIRLNATVQQNVITYPVIIEVANPGERLRPKMTADVTIDVETVEDALRLPNAALRFRPPETTPGTGTTGGRPTGGRPAGGGERSGKPEKREQTVYRLGEGDALLPVAVETGITDGRFTVLATGELQEGDTIVVGAPTTRVEGTGRPPGMGRM